MYLHPGLQRKIIEFFQSEACSRHHFFCTTHSNHLLDLTLDFENTSVFQFHQQSQKVSGNEDEDDSIFIIRQVDQGESSTLKQLGVRNSSVFLANASIWVEGITDRLYIRKLLDLYQEHKEFTGANRIAEDVDYAFVEYAGSNLAHYVFPESLRGDQGETEDVIDGQSESPAMVNATRLCSRALIIVDDDGVDAGDDSEGKEWKRELRDRLGDQVLVTPGREIENILPQEVLYAVVTEGRQKLEEFEKDTLGTYEEYKSELLGRYLDKKLEGKVRKTYAGKSGTIKGDEKTNFCTRALKAIESKGLKFEDFDEGVQGMIEKIYQHVVDARI